MRTLIDPRTSSCADPVGGLSAPAILADLLKETRQGFFYVEHPRMNGKIRASLELTENLLYLRDLYHSMRNLRVPGRVAKYAWMLQDKSRYTCTDRA